MKLWNPASSNCTLSCALNSAWYCSRWSHATGMLYTCISAFHRNFVVLNQSCNLAHWSTLHNINILIHRKRIHCHLFPAIHLLWNLCCIPPAALHPYEVAIHIKHNLSTDGIHHLSSISGRNLSLAMIPPRPWSISHHNSSSAAIQFIQAIRFYPVHNCTRMGSIPWPLL